MSFDVMNNEIGHDILDAPNDQPMSAKEINELYCLLDRTWLNEVSVASPEKIYTAVSVVCDIECPYCPRQYFDKEFYKHGFMPFPKFENVAPFTAAADYVGLFGLGEPFLHPRFFEYVESVKSVGGPVATSTHGMSLTDEIIEKILDMEIDRLSISMDGPNKKIFHFLRAGADFDTVCERVKNLTRRKKERDLDNPMITIACTVSRHNYRYMCQMAKMAAKLGANELTFADLIIVDPKNAHLSVHGHPDFKKQLRKAMTLANKLGLQCEHYPQYPYLWMKPRQEKPPGAYGCSELWRTFEIDREGIVNPCCYLEEGFGNVFDEDLGQLKNHPKRKQFRKDCMNNTPHATCSTCQYYERNTPDRVEGILQQIEQRLGDPRLPEEHRKKLRKHIADYRKKSENLFADIDNSGASPPMEYDYNPAISYPLTV